MPVKAETKARATEFINAMNNLIETVEKFKADAIKSKNKTLIMAMGVLSADFKKALGSGGKDDETGVRGTKIYKEASRQNTAVVKSFKAEKRKEIRPLPLTEMPDSKYPKLEKYVDAGGKKWSNKAARKIMMNCPVCKRPMTRGHYLENHSKAAVCVHIEEVREKDGAKVPKHGDKKKVVLAEFKPATKHVREDDDVEEEEDDEEVEESEDEEEEEEKSDEEEEEEEEEKEKSEEEESEEEEEEEEVAPVKTVAPVKKIKINHIKPAAPAPVKPAPEPVKPAPEPVEDDEIITIKPKRKYNMTNRLLKKAAESKA